MDLVRMAARRMLPTTGAVYYGTETFVYPGDLGTGSAAVALPPGTQVIAIYGYDFMCLLKDIRKTDCHALQISVWSVMSCIAAMVMIFCIILIPIACIYRSGKFAGSSMKKMFKGGGSSYPEYEEMEKRAARNSQDMPVPPKSSQFRQGPNYANTQDDWEE